MVIMIMMMIYSPHPQTITTLHPRSHPLLVILRPSPVLRALVRGIFADCFPTYDHFFVTSVRAVSEVRTLFHNISSMFARLTNTSDSKCIIKHTGDIIRVGNINTYNCVISPSCSLDTMDTLTWCPSIPCLYRLSLLNSLCVRHVLSRDLWRRPVPRGRWREAMITSSLEPVSWSYRTR